MTGVARMGIALPLALVALLALSLLAAAMLLLASHQTRIAYARLDALRGRYAAESAARAALGDWRTERHRDLRVGEEERLTGAGATLAPRVEHEAVVQRLDRRTYLVRALGRVRRPGAGAEASARARVGVLVRTIDPVDLWVAFGAALAVAGAVDLSSGARVDGIAADATPPVWPASVCEAARVDYGKAFGDVARPGLWMADTTLLGASPEAVLAGDPPIDRDTALGGSTGAPSLGPLDPRTLETIADRLPTGSIELRSPADGECDEAAPDVWGDPLDPASPCGDSFPLIFAAGDLDVTGGAGQGVLIVTGDLALGPGVRFYGPILVVGALALGPDAEVYGAARSIDGEHRSSIDGAISYNACALGRAFRSSPALNGPFRPESRWWTPLF